MVFLPSPFGRRVGDEGLPEIRGPKPLTRDEFARLSEFISRSLKGWLASRLGPHPNPLPEGEGTLLTSVRRVRRTSCASPKESFPRTYVPVLIGNACRVRR